ncbi:Imm51 family immunity protein [Microbacterium sp. NPDC077057]|uniref:Imm51 family immunity protein n=1 Tax=Microbacterium sp. NPDC077057 TaxID=3154763 RepID=UPI003414DB65
MEKKMHTSFIDHSEDGEDSYSLVLGLSGPETEIDRAVDAEGLEITSWEMTGYFWQIFVQYLWPELAEQVSFDSEAGMFCAYGSSPEPLKALQNEFEPVLNDPALVVATIIRGQAEGQAFY